MKKTKYIFALQPFFITFGIFLGNGKVNGVVATVDGPTIATLIFSITKVLHIKATNTKKLLEKLRSRETLLLAKKKETQLVKEIKIAAFKASQDMKEFSWLNAKVMIKNATQCPTGYNLLRSPYTKYNNAQQLTASLQFRLGYGGKK